MMMGRLDRNETWWSTFMLMLLLLLMLVWKPVKSDSIPASSKYKEVVNVVGSVGQIPCPVTDFDDVVMILWFRGGSGAPIYSYDARNEEIEPRHMTLKDEWGLRLYFRVWPNNRRYPALMIQDLGSGDGGLYRCRVDYRNSPTTNSVTRLKIIEPPTRLEVRDTSPSRPISDQMMTAGGAKHSDPSLTYMGPYTEGQNVTLVCSAYGGRPLPEVRWYRNGDLVDTSYSLSGTEYAINEMTISNLGRTHTSDLYSCQANNNNETQALTHKVQLDIYLGVTTVELEVPSPMTAGSEYNLVCKTMGAYPTVKVEFWRNLKRIASRSQMKSVADNMTITSILYKPEVSDDDSTIICKAENPWVARKPTVARKTMKIKYSPLAVLRLGRNRTTALSEGESVLMECHVKANPPAHTILWFHQGQQLSGNNDTVGLQLNGRTLFISYLSHHVGGDYNCEAVNDVGKGISNTLPIVLHLSPKCVASEAARIPLAIGETHWLTCNILAWPSDLNFYWTLNRSDSSGSNGEIKSVSRNLTEHRLPIFSSMAPGRLNVTTRFPTSSSNPTPPVTVTQGAGDDGKEHYEKSQGYPQLSSGSPPESLDYPEDQHIMPLSEDPDSESPWKTEKKKERGSGGKNILFESHSEKKAILAGKSTSHSVVSTSTRGRFAADLGKLLDGDESLSKNATTTTKVGTKSKRHVVYPSSPSMPPQQQQQQQPLFTGKGREGPGFQDRIRHTSLISYQVRSDEDYGTVACWATNSFGSQVLPCLYHITRREEHAGRQIPDRKENGRKTTSVENGATQDKASSQQFRNLTGSSSRGSVGGLPDSIQGGGGGGGVSVEEQQGFSKLQKTLGIVLLLILIFIAGLAGLVFSMLFVLAKRRGELRRIVIAHGPSRSRRSSRSSSSSTCSKMRRGSKTTSKIGGGYAAAGAAVNKSGSSEHGHQSGQAPTCHQADDEGGGGGLAIVQVRVQDFQGMAVEGNGNNDGEPELSTISGALPPLPSNKQEPFNNMEPELLGPPMGYFGSSGCTENNDMDGQLQFNFSEESEHCPDFIIRSMTPRAVELFGGHGSDGKGEGFVAGHSEAGGTGGGGEYHSHLDKDCLLQDGKEQQHLH